MRHVKVYDILKGSTIMKYVIRPLVPEDVYTDRTEFLDYLYHAAREAAHRRTTSTVLLGRRRMGKTEIFKRVINRLFIEQDPNDPYTVIPVYYSFKEEKTDRWEFAVGYVENILRWMTAFHLRDPKIILTREITRQEIVPFIRSKLKITVGLDGALRQFESFQQKDITVPEEEAVIFPRRISDYDDITIVMFLDEFQNTRLPQYDFSIVGYMQEAVESPTCPHFVTGSAMTILSREIIGKRALFGRFDSKPISEMTGYWGAELARKVAVFYHADVADLMAPVISDRCGGNPFYITAVVKQAAKTVTSISDEETLNRILAVDLSSGFIWGELHDQVTQWIERINEHKITKWVLYLSALDENTDESRRGELKLEQIQKQLMDREGRHVPLETIRDVLIKLSRGDLVEYLELGGWFRKVDDPILLEFLKVWGKIEVEGQHPHVVQEELIRRFRKQERRFREYRGYLAEVHMSQILWNTQRKKLPARFFHTAEDIQMPHTFIHIAHRHRLRSGKGQEIDVLGAAWGEQWVYQSKWIQGKKVALDVLTALWEQGEAVKAEKEPDAVRLWLFAHDGLTGEAETYAREKGILWSSRQEMDELLEYAGLRRLPELKG